MSHQILSLSLFGAFLALTFLIIYRVGRQTQSASEFYTAGRRIRGYQNGLAIAGDYVSGASLLGTVGLIALFGFDGVMYVAGFLVALVVVLLMVAEPLRNTQAYTMADALAFRLRKRPVRAAAATSTLVISVLYLTTQMVGAGTLVGSLLGLEGRLASTVTIAVVGAIMIFYVTVGGMAGTTWVQIIKAVLLLALVGLIALLVMGRFGFSLSALLDGATNGASNPGGYLQPGNYFSNPVDLISLTIALTLGTAGLPHVLMRFFTVPDAKTARSSASWAIGIVGSIYLCIIVMGLGAAALLGSDAIRASDPSGNTTSLLLAELLGGGADSLGGTTLVSVLSAVAFATILAVVAGLTLTASASFAHDLYKGVLVERRLTPGRERSEVGVARMTAVVLGVISVVLAALLQSVNLVFLVGVVFAIAASANLPSLVLSLYWRRFNTAGAVTGIVVGLVSCLTLVVLSPTMIGPDGLLAQTDRALFPLVNPGIVSVPLALVAAVIATLLTKPEPADVDFDEFREMALVGAPAAQRSPE